MVMSITFALQQKHQDEQNSLSNAVKLLMQSPGYIQVFGGTPPQQELFFPYPYSVSYSHHGQHISQEEV